MSNNPKIIENIFNYAKQNPNHIALANPLCDVKTMDYGTLFNKAYALAKYIVENTTNNNPIVVYGHKNPYMIVCFLACSLSGHAYCPVDSSMPLDRVEKILEQTDSEFMFAIDNFETNQTKVISLDKVKELTEKNSGDICIPKECVKGNDTYYIIFTSGSTGTPKGVQISADDLDNFLVWSKTLGEEKGYSDKTVFLNQAPFSFDLSVMDLYTSLYCGSTLCMMEKSVQKDLAAITPFIKANNINAIVATPSFVNMCLLDRSFTASNIPTIESFFFCGEVLSNKTAKKVIERFPQAVVQNTYGPTESTVAVSGIRITPKVLEEFYVLPVGKAKPGTSFVISDYEKREEDGHTIGEVLILGDTLAKGYFKREDLTQKAFIDYNLDGKVVKAYRTGDLGYLSNEQLFYCGRIDLQIKLNGFRIELGDIESCILKEKYIDTCAVVPRISDGKVKGLIAVIVLTKGYEYSEIEKGLKEHIKNTLPPYMIPQSIEVLDKLPTTNNGKVDRKKIIEIIEEA